MKSILKNWHRYLLWLVVSFFFWAWIFTLITDAPAQKKLVLYADCPAMEREALDAELEKAMPEGIRFVEARVFSDEMFSPTNLTSGDLFILRRARPTASASTTNPGAWPSGRSTWPTSPGRPTTSSSTPVPPIWASGTARRTTRPSPPPGRFWPCRERNVLYSRAIW